MIDIATSSILLLSCGLLSYINYKILLITLRMLEVTIDIKDVSIDLLGETKKLRESFIIRALLLTNQYLKLSGVI